MAKHRRFPKHVPDLYNDWLSRLQQHLLDGKWFTRNRKQIGASIAPAAVIHHHSIMQRVMIIGQPGAGKSTLARYLGALTHLPVVHIDHIHWKSGWIERDRAEKSAMTLEVIKDRQWIFEGGHSVTWPERLDRADTLIWLDISLSLRAWRVLRRTLLNYGRTRPDLPDGCPEQFSLEFWSWIWRTRHTGRQRMQELYESAPVEKATYHLTSTREVNAFLSNLSEALAIGNLGIPHR